MKNYFPGKLFFITTLFLLSIKCIAQDKIKSFNLVFDYLEIKCNRIPFNENIIKVDSNFLLEKSEIYLYKSDDLSIVFEYTIHKKENYFTDIQLTGKVESDGKQYFSVSQWRDLYHKNSEKNIKIINELNDINSSLNSLGPCYNRKNKMVFSVKYTIDYELF